MPERLTFLYAAQRVLEHAVQEHVAGTEGAPWDAVGKMNSDTP